MKKKSLITMLTALCLAGVVMVGATLAYLTASTDEKVNTFTVGNIKIDLEEPDWDPENGKDLEVGAEVAKNPMILNTGKNDGYVIMQVTGMDDMAAQGFSAKYDSENWTLVDTNGTALSVPEGSALVDGYYAYNRVLPAGDTTPALFENVTFNGGEQEDITHMVTAVIDEETGVITGYEYIIGGVTYTAASYAEAEAALVEEYGAELGYVFDLIVKGYAIQTKGFEDGDTTQWVPALLGEVQE